jgi:hypothetical protein
LAGTDQLVMAVVLVTGDELGKRAGEIQHRAEHGQVIAVRDGRMPSRGIRCSVVPGLPHELDGAEFVDLDGNPVEWPHQNGHGTGGDGHDHH